MPASNLAAHEPDLDGIRVLVVGAGKSGRAAATLAAGRGARVRVADLRGPSEAGAEVLALAGSGIALSLGGHPPELAADADLVILSPGVPGDVAVVAAARERGVPVWGEVELAARFCRGSIVGITGSNGKSTTTSMIGAVLRGAGIPGGTGGNLDVPLADLLSLDRPGAWHAVELSSFQLETIDRFRAAIAVVVNLSPDHLDRYPSYRDYARAKARLLETQDTADAAILNADDPESRFFDPFVRGRELRFSTRDEVPRGAFVRDGRIVLRTEHGEDDVAAVDEIPVPGEHNVANALAAALACRLVGCSPGAIARGLRGYRALPHRLAHLATVAGVKFYDDSKATNLDSAARAVRSFPPGTIHLVLGGKDKGGDWAAFRDVVRGRVARVLLVGKAAPAIRAGLGDTVPLEDCGTVERAVAAGFAGAAPGDVVLLSPGCASFDQYRNFEERGRDFARAVAALAEREGRDA